MKTIKFDDGILTIGDIEIVYNNIFFTSDQHFEHGNIIKYCTRPFRCRLEMNKHLTANWNNAVKYNDVVIIHGDFIFGDLRKWRAILTSLNGYKILIRGNHDREKDIPTDSFLLVEDMIELYIRDKDDWKNIICCHYPILCYKGKEKGFWQTYGHVHTREWNTGSDYHLLKYLSSNQYDVGVDNNDFTPISFDKLKQIIAKQNHNEN